ncbi:hypothetical protein BN946_scf184915.g46 [Trametes cinnabarina]|uniref:Nickel/cobalt efflux system n=1 Tax=Pycnoporus cinnabarinus TaxID=5643 RepID=A0A060SB36_PYCCI|nr:hypothetical protein BN946_scf184915.g46 [Trametes cinnabarina]
MSRSLRGTSVLPRLTLLGRSLLLLAAELLANAICWITCGILFGRGPETRPILSLALLAWAVKRVQPGMPDNLPPCNDASHSTEQRVEHTYHIHRDTHGLASLLTSTPPALDADHIRLPPASESAIDNATRSLINMGQLPVTCGLFFSLGHSTIVVVVNVAIAISTDVYNHIDGVGAVGGIVGSAVSASFLFIVGLANSIILFRILRKRYRVKKRRAARARENVEAGAAHTAIGDKRDSTIGRDQSTAENLDDNGDDGKADELHGNTLMMKVIGPVVTFVDRPWKMYPVGLLFGFAASPAAAHADVEMLPRRGALAECEANEKDEKDVPEVVAIEDVPGRDPGARLRVLRVKRNAMSSLSILLTVMSIFVAFSISLITIMGLVGDNCAPCQNAANAPDGGGLAGRWWRGWAKANDNSGYIGAAIVGSFIAVVSVWYGARYLYRQWQARTKGSAMIKP